jgi:hypothetical protein
LLAAERQLITATVKTLLCLTMLINTAYLVWAMTLVAWMKAARHDLWKSAGEPKLLMADIKRLVALWTFLWSPRVIDARDVALVGRVATWRALHVLACGSFAVLSAWLIISKVASIESL